MKQVRWFRVSVLAAVTLMSSLALAAQTVDLAGIQQKLKERITLATLDGNGEIATAGSVVTLQKSSLQMCATTAPANAGAPANTYKNGKLSAGMFSFNFGLGLMKIDPNSIPMHTSVAGEKFWIVLYNVRKNGVEFKLWTDPDSNNIRYWSWLEIPIDKKQNPSADEVMKTISEVIAVEPVDQGGQTVQSAGSTGQSAPIQGRFVDRGNKADFIEFSPDGRLALFQSGKTYLGTYEVTGDTVIASGPQIRGKVELRIVGDTVTYKDGTIYEKQAEPVNSSRMSSATSAIRSTERSNSPRGKVAMAWSGGMIRFQSG